MAKHDLALLGMPSNAEGCSLTTSIRDAEALWSHIAIITPSERCVEVEYVTIPTVGGSPSPNGAHTRSALPPGSLPFRDET